MLCLVFPSTASSPSISPTTLANLKPCPENPAADRSTHALHIVFVNRPVDGLGCGLLALQPKGGDLRSAVGSVLGRKAVELRPVRRLPDVYGETPDLKRSRPTLRVEPVHDLPFHNQGELEIMQQTGAPRPRRDHRGRGLEPPRRGNDTNSSPSCRPFQNRLVEVQLRTELRRPIEVCADATFRIQIAGALLVQTSLFGSGSKRRATPVNLCSIEHLVWQIVFLRTTQAAGDNVGLGSPQHQPTGHRQQTTPRLLLQAGPQLVGAIEKRHVRRILEISLPDDPGTAVARAFVVRGPELLDAEHRAAGGGELVRGPAPPRSEADDDHVEVAHGRTFLTTAPATRPASRLRRTRNSAFRA